MKDDMMPGKHCTGGWKRLSLSSPLSDFETPELNVCCFLANIPGSLQRQQTINAGLKGSLLVPSLLQVPIILFFLDP
jgi:hypothetical protein